MQARLHLMRLAGVDIYLDWSLLTISPNDDSVRALQLLGQHGVNQLPVVDNGQVRGRLRREDILRCLSLYSDSTRIAA